MIELLRLVLKWCISCAVIIFIALNIEGALEVVDTSLGKVKGVRKGQIIEYLGIPFAEPPTGNLRFRPTVPRKPWYPSLWNAQQFAPECLQSTVLVADDGTVRDEDCLYLNIWRPIGHDYSHPLPVLVWFYGGAFIHGGSAKLEYNGQYLSEKGVVVVSFNYRLGALGFLVSVRDGLYGNYGLEDQRVALEWISTNIKMFGGDPSKITLFGESAGAMSIGLHFLQRSHSKDESVLVSHPIHRATFHRVIMQSNPLGYKYRSISVANFLGEGFKEQLECEDLKCLQNESIEELLHVQDSLMAVPRSIGDFFTWGPVLTDHAYYQERRKNPSFISNISVFQPLETLHRLHYFNIPVLLGSNTHEGNLFVYGAFSAKMTKMVFQAVLYGFFREMTPKVLQAYSGLISQISKLTQSQSDYRTVLSQIISDYLFRCPTQQFADELHGMGFPVYLYEFGLPTKLPNFLFCDGLSCHTSEIPYVFANKDIILNHFSWQSPFDTKSTTEDAINEQQVFQHRFSSWFENIFNSFFDENLRDRLPDKMQIMGRTVDEYVADLMSSFWIMFADKGSPSTQHYWWPNLKPNQMVLSTDSISTFRVQLTIQGTNSAKIQLSTKKQLLHQMTFGLKTKVVVIENDCICDFWHSLNYRF